MTNKKELGIVSYMPCWSMKRYRAKIQNDGICIVDISHMDYGTIHSTGHPKIWSITASKGSC